MAKLPGQSKLVSSEVVNSLFSAHGKTLWRRKMISNSADQPGRQPEWQSFANHFRLDADALLQEVQGFVSSCQDLCCSTMSAVLSSDAWLSPACASPTKTVGSTLQNRMLAIVPSADSFQDLDAAPTISRCLKRSRSFPRLLFLALSFCPFVSLDLPLFAFSSFCCFLSCQIFTLCSRPSCQIRLKTTLWARKTSKTIQETVSKKFPKKLIWSAFRLKSRTSSVNGRR